MNIEKIFQSVNGLEYNSQNSAYLLSVAEDIPQYQVGKNGLIRDDIEVMAQNLKSCTTSGVIAHNYDLDQHKILELHSCGNHKLCPVCADKVSGQRIKKVDKALRDNWEDVRYAYMLTFTVQDGEDLYRVEKLLRESYRAWYRKGQKRRNGRSGGEAAKILGESKSLEIKLGENSGLWHPHYHVICFTKKPLDYRVYNAGIKKEVQAYLKNIGEAENDNLFLEEMKARGGLLHPIERDGEIVAASKLTKEWHDITGGEGLNVDIQTLWTPRNRPDDFVSFLDGKNAATKAVKYSLKYSLKHDDFECMTSQQMFTLLDVMKKARTIEYRGFLRKSPTKRTEQEKREAEEKQALLKEVEVDELREFVSGADIESVRRLEEYEGLITELNYPTEYALWSIGFDAQREYKVRVCEKVSEYSAIRRYLFSEWQLGFITNREFVETVREAKKALRADSRMLRMDRDREVLRLCKEFEMKAEDRGIDVSLMVSNLVENIAEAQKYKGLIPSF